MKIVRFDGAYIEVRSDERYIRCSDHYEKMLLDDLGGMIHQIKRHVDGVSSVRVVRETQEICSHCRYDWEVDEKHGFPLCCEKAQKEWEAETGKSVEEIYAAEEAMQ